MVSMRRIRQQPTSALLCIGLLALGGCRPSASRNEATKAAQRPAANPAAKVPLPQPPMDRAALLAAVANAVSAAASGENDSAAQRALDGKPFELSIRFGCAGPQERLAAADLGWTYDGTKRVLRVRAMPTLTADDPTVKAVTPADVEAVEGFWIARPWVLESVCPVASPQPQPQPQPEKAAPANSSGEPPLPPVTILPRVGIAQFFTSDDPRSARRNGRAYEAVRTLESDKPVGTAGFDLILSGRLRAIGGGKVIRCAAAAANLPPDCIVSARIDGVRLQSAIGERIAEWGS